MAPVARTVEAPDGWSFRPAQSGIYVSLGNDRQAQLQAQSQPMSPLVTQQLENLEWPFTVQLRGDGVVSLRCELDRPIVTASLHKALQPRIS